MSHRVDRIPHSCGAAARERTSGGGGIAPVNGAESHRPFDRVWSRTMSPIWPKMRVSFAVLIAVLLGLAALASSAAAQEFQIRTGDNGACLDAPVQAVNAYNVVKSGSGAQLWQCVSNSVWQQWYVDAAGGGAVRIRTAEGGLCLGPRPGTSIANGTLVQLWPCVASDTAQEWIERGNLLVDLATAATKTPRNLDAEQQDIGKNG